MFITDKPINNKEEDRLGREFFAENLADAILSYKNNDNFTISLCGKWGSGKTSIINMIINRIEENKQCENKPLIVKFNPWNYTDKSQLIGQFFKTILSEIGAKDEAGKLKEVGRALERYSGLIEYMQCIPVIGKYIAPFKETLSKVGITLTEIGEEKDSLNNVKNKVIEELQKQNQKIVVIIDDIDRLNNEQIRLIFQLVNSVADFPNMIYVLVFDKEVVVRALATEQNCDGEKYLEKIIQVPFEIPDANVSNVHHIFFEKIDEIIFDNTNDNIFDEEYWNSIFNNCISPYIHTIRDVNRIVNVFRFKYGLLHNETNCIDLLAITTIQVCSPALYEWIKNNINILKGGIGFSEISTIEQKENEERFLKELESIGVEPEMSIKVVQTIFPKFSWKTGSYYGTREVEDELRKAQRIACLERSSIYFRLSLEDISISKELIQDSINKYNEKELDELFMQLFQSNNDVQYLKELKACSKDITNDRAPIFIKKMFCWATFNSRNKTKGELRISVAGYCNDCCLAIIENIGQEESFNVLESLIDNLDDEAFLILVATVVNVEKAYNRMNGTVYKDYRIVTEEKLELLEEKICIRLKEMTNNIFLLKYENFWEAKYFLEYMDKEFWNNHMNESLKVIDNIPYYINANIHLWHSGSTYKIEFNGEVLSQYISLEEIYNSILSFKGIEKFSNLEPLVQEAVVAFYLWYNSEDGEEKIIPKEKIEEVISEWLPNE